MTVPNDTASRRSPEDPARPFVPLGEVLERLLDGLPSRSAAERLGAADPIQEWESHGIAPHSAAAPAPAAASPLPETDTEAPDAVQLSLALDEAARPEWPAVRFFEWKGEHHRAWDAASRAPWLQLSAENSLAALAYEAVDAARYASLVAAAVPPATWTVLDGRGRLSVAWALLCGVHWNAGSPWAWRKRYARTIDQELAMALGARAQIGRALEARLPRRLHANPAARPTPWRHVRWTGERYRLRHLDMRSRGTGVITPEGSGAAVTGRAVGGLASGSARQVLAAERRILVADLVGKGRFPPRICPGRHRSPDPMPLRGLLELARKRPMALLFTSRRSLPARRLAALAARAGLSTDCQGIGRLKPILRFHSRVENVTGTMTQTGTGLPQCFAGENRIPRVTRNAASSSFRYPELFSICCLVTRPPSSTSSHTEVLPPIPLSRSSAGYSRTNARSIMCLFV